MAGRRQSDRRRPQAVLLLMQHDRLETSHIVPEAHELKFKTSVPVVFWFARPDLDELCEFLGTAAGFGLSGASPWRLDDAA
jgi:hypothetical protein